MVISGFADRRDKLVIVDYFKNGNDVTIADSNGVLGTLNDILDEYLYNNYIFYAVHYHMHPYDKLRLNIVYTIH
mgnify:CR=1 FL=1